MEIYDYTIYDMLSRNVISFRKNPAWFEAEMNETFTFAQFKKKVDRLAAGLQKNGVKISSLGRGLSTGTELEYSDNDTIKNALLNRQ